MSKLKANEYVSKSFPEATLIMDSNPGSGPAQTLKASLPWSTDYIFVTEANIYYDSDLILQMFETISASDDIVGVFGITPRIDVAATHRAVSIEGKLNLSGKKVNDASVKFRNMGTWMLRLDFREELTDEAGDIIDILHDMTERQITRQPVQHESNYLHIAVPQDIILWCESL